MKLILGVCGKSIAHYPQCRTKCLKSNGKNSQKIKFVGSLAQPVHVLPLKML